MKKLILLSLSLCLVSCKNVEEEFFENGNLFKRYTMNEKKEFDGSYEEYFENGNIKEQHIYKDGIKVDSSRYFYENNPIIRQVDLYLSNDTIVQKNFYTNGNIESSGKIVNGNKIGYWIYNRENGSLEKEFEYKIIKDQQYTNQGRHYDIKGNLLKDLGNYYDLRLSSTDVKLKDTVFLDINYKPVLALNSTSYLCISSEINNDFSNINNIPFDTIYMENNSISNFILLFKSRGVKNIKGFINEYYTKEAYMNDSIVQVDRRLYLNFKIKVK